MSSMDKRFYTQEQRDALIANYGKMLAKDLAKMIGRSVSSVHNTALRYGLTEKRDHDLIESRAQKVAELNAQGWSDQEVADAIGISRRSIRNYRDKLGLEPNGRNERYRKRVSENTRRQLEKAGVSSLAGLKSLEVKKYVRSLGWPDTLSLGSAFILELLYTRGPMTRRQLSEATGFRWKGTRKSLCNNRVPGGSYLAELQRAGLVVRLKNAINGMIVSGHGRQDIYMVGLEVEPCQKTRGLSRSVGLRNPSTES